MTLAWTTTIAPGKDEIARLCAELKIPAKLLSHSLDPNEHPRVRILDGVTFVLLRVPSVEPEGADVPFRTVPLGIVMGPRAGLVIASRDCDVMQGIDAFLSECSSTAKPHRLLLHALELTAESFLTKLDAIDASADAAEKRLAESLENRQVLELLRYQKSLVFFSSALEGMFPLLERMQKAEGFHVAPEDEEWLAGVVIELRQALETSNLQRSVMSEMMDAFASIISNNLNVVMKFLATVTVILTLPMIVASFYGMNVRLPGQGHEHAFVSTVIASLALGVAFAAYFRRRGWI